MTRAELSGLVDLFQFSDIFLGQVDNFDIR